MKVRLIYPVLIILFILSACGGGGKKSTPMLVSTMQTGGPPVSAVPATAAPTTPTATTVPVTPKPTVTATSRPTPTSISAIGPDFPPNVNPLTGLEVADESVLERCPIAIKVSNAPSVVRPQAGLDKADLVFEHYAEGGVTRLTAVFLGQDPSMVGSVRSGRLLDVEIAAMFQVIFAYSGTSVGVGGTYARSDMWPDQLASPWTASTAFYRRDLNKATEHTLFVDPAKLWAVAEQRGFSERKDLGGWVFAATPPPNGYAVHDFQILYLAGISQVEWVYDESDGRYYRWQGGAAHNEELTGAQLSAANVVVVTAEHIETLIVEDTWGGGHYSIEIQIWDEGPVSIFRDGQRYDGMWRRPDRHQPFSFWTQDGSERIPFKPGNTWFQMAPKGFTGLIKAP